MPETFCKAKIISIELPPREKLIDDLMFSDADAGAIVSMHAKEMEETEQASRVPKFSTGIAAHNVASGE